MIGSQNGGSKDLPTIQDKVKLDSPEEGIPYVCRALLPGWGEFSVEDVKVSAVSGGISNLVFKAQLSNGSRPVLVRVYGVNTELTVNRVRELEVLQYVSSKGFGAKVLGLFGNGRIEVFLDSRPLSVEEMGHPAVVPKIAKKLADLHNLHPKIPNSKPGLVCFLQDYLSKVETIKFEDPTRQQRFEKYIDLGKIKDTLNEAIGQFSSLVSPLVLCHNDLLSGNILVLQKPETAHTLEESEITLVDFEYACYSYRGYDFADHFMEYQGSEMISSRYPSEKQQREFFECYLTHSEGRGNVSNNLTVDQLIKEVEFFKPFPPAMWGLWAIIQARYSTIDFDYLEYALKCLNEFLLNFKNRKI